MRLVSNIITFHIAEYRICFLKFPRVKTAVILPGFS